MTIPERQTTTQLQRVIVRPERVLLAPFQQRLIGFFSSFLLALAQIVLIHIAFLHAHSFFDVLAQVTVGLLLLYFVVPIPLSAYLSYQTGKLGTGRHEGGKVGCMGAVLALFFMLAYIYIYTLLFASFGFWAVPIYLIGVLLTFISVFVAQLGALVGSMVGVNRRK